MAQQIRPFLTLMVTLLFLTPAAFGQDAKLIEAAKKKAR